MVNPVAAFAQGIGQYSVALQNIGPTIARDKKYLFHLYGFSHLSFSNIPIFRRKYHVLYHKPWCFLAIASPSYPKLQTCEGAGGHNISTNTRAASSCAWADWAARGQCH
jgi:hypothetical protein